MERVLQELNVDDLLSRPTHGPNQIVVRESRFQRQEGRIDPGDISLDWRQSHWPGLYAQHYRTDGLILSPPAKPGDWPGFTNLTLVQAWTWDGLSVDYFYHCPKNLIVAAFEERWVFDGHSELGGYVVVLSDWALFERIKPSLC